MNASASQTKRAWAGAGIIALLLLIGTFIFLLDDILARLRPKYAVVAVLHQAPGVAAGSPVWLSGRALGSVLEVGLLPTGADGSGRVAVRIELPAAVREQVRRDSRVRLASERLIGDPVLDIVGGSATAPVLAAGDTLYQAPTFDAAETTARARAFQLSLDTALAELRAVQAPLEARLAAFEQVQQQLGRAQAEYRQLMADVRTSPALGLLDQEALGGAVGESRRTLEQLMQQLTALGARAEETGLTGNAQGLLTSTQQLRSSLATLDSAMQARGGTLDRMARDSALVHAIAAAQAALDSLIADARRRPLRYVF